MPRRLVPALALLLGCSSAAAPSKIPVDEVVTARSANPDGVAYPTEHLGGSPRSGATPGSRIPNFAFRGYIDSDKAAGLKEVSLADYFDPTGARYKVIHVMAAAVWCPVCQGQSKDMVLTRDALRAEGVVSIQILVQGPSQGTGPTLGDLDTWIDRHETSFTVVVDSNARKLSQIVTLTGVPWNALVDARTMEILHAGLGAPANFEKYARAGLALVAEAPR